MKITKQRIRYHTLNFQVFSKLTQLGHCPCLTNSTSLKALVIMAPHPLTKDTENSISKLLEIYVSSGWLFHSQNRIKKLSMFLYGKHEF